MRERLSNIYFMKGINITGLLIAGIILVLLLSFCKADDPPEPPTTYPQLFINEIMPDNESVLEDDQGEHDDWIEIYNSNDEAVNIAGWYISDDARNLQLFSFAYSDPASTTIPAKDFLILWADEQPGQGALHLNFRLSSTGESIYLSANGSNVVHQVSYGPDGNAASPGTDRSAGLETDGGSNWKTFITSTPGYSNEGGAVQANIFINEFMAGNDFFIGDESGEYDDWIELYNSGSAALDIGGWYITDDSLVVNKWQFPDSIPEQTTISPGGFLLLWADEQPEQGVLHVGIKLNVDGEMIGISPDGLTFSQLLSFGPGTAIAAPSTNQSAGRSEDGGPDWMVFQPGTVSPPTPGMPNGSAGGL